MKKRLLALVQFGLGAGLLTYLFVRLKRSGELSELVEALHTATRHWPFLAVAIAIFGACVLLCSARWQVLLRSQGIELPLRRTVMLYLVGHFFSGFMLGATGGDVVRAYYVTTETHHRRTEAVMTIFIDRAIGLLSLILLTALITLGRLRFFLAQEQTRVAVLFNGVLLVGAAAGLLVVFRRNLFERWEIFRRLEQRTAFGPTVRRAYDAFHFCLSRPALLAKTTGLSLLNHVGSVTIAYCLALALGVNVGYVSLLSVYLVINAIATLPLTPGGLGTRESAAVYLLGAVGVPQAQAMTISLLYYATIMLWAAIGGLLYLGYSASRGSPGAKSASSRSMPRS